MNEVRFENKGNKFLFSWPEYQLQAEVSRISINHDTTRCLLIFTSRHPEAKPHILQTRFNLESARTRSDLAKEMGMRYKIKEQIDWKNLIEYLSVKTIREYEKGEPIIQISSQDEATPLEYLIYPIAPLHKPAVIFGDPGAGKSQVAVVFNILIALPWQDNPLRLIVPNKPTKALFLDYEADEEDVRRQLVSLTSRMELGLLYLNYRRCSLPLTDDIEAIRNHIEEIEAECLFIDSMSLAAGGDLNRMDVATAYFRALRQLKGITSISFAHTSKDRETKNKTIMGSVLWEAGARSVWEIRGEEEEDAFNIALFHRKANLSKKAKPLGYQFKYESDLPVSIQWYDPKNVPEFIARMSLKTRLIEYLKKRGKATIETIASDLEENKTSVRSRLNEGKDKVFIQFENSCRVDNKLIDEWGLLSQGALL